MKTETVRNEFKNFRESLAERRGLDEIDRIALGIVEDLLFNYGIEYDDFDEFTDVVVNLDEYGNIHECVDGAVPIYNHELLEWAKDNYEYVDDAKRDGLIDASADLIQQLQGGYYFQLDRVVRDLLDEFRDKR